MNATPSSWVRAAELWHTERCSSLTLFASRGDSLCAIIASLHSLNQSAVSGKSRYNTTWGWPPRKWSSYSTMWSLHTLGLGLRFAPCTKSSSAIQSLALAWMESDIIISYTCTGDVSLQTRVEHRAQTAPCFPGWHHAGLRWVQITSNSYITSLQIMLHVHVHSHYSCHHR